MRLCEQDLDPWSDVLLIQQHQDKQDILFTFQYCLAAFLPVAERTGIPVAARLVWISKETHISSLLRTNTELLRDVNKTFEVCQVHFHSICAIPQGQLMHIYNKQKYAILF